MRRGLLLINLGTPNRPDLRSVRQYLREFLSDRRVVTLPTLLRYALLYGFILPLRARNTAKAYQAIWTEQGSPLRYYSERLCTQLQQKFGPSIVVTFGMRYGQPSIADALTKLQDCEHITILPLYPQYASSATGSAIEAVLRLLAPNEVIPSLHIIRDFYQHEAYIRAQAAQIQTYLKPNTYLLFSYHGVPEQHLQSLGCKPVCQQACPAITPISKHAACYRAQCFATSRALANALNLPENRFSTCFQSRLGRAPWIKPYLDEILPTLIHQGVKHLAITCPSFVTDCLETLEEINMRARMQWLNLGGETFTFVPALNDGVHWVEGIEEIILNSTDCNHLSC